MNAENKTLFWSDLETPIGCLTLTASGRGLNGLFFPGRAPQRDEVSRDPERLERAATQLHEYFAGLRRRFDLQLDLSGGTAFQRSVWAQLQTIPHGQTISYRELAGRLGPQNRVRAVGAAVGRTPIPIIVPCHRVIGSDGRLTGYLGGLRRKQALLELEAAVSHGQAPPRSPSSSQLTMM